VGVPRTAVPSTGLYTAYALSLLLNERTDLSPEMALRIEKAFGPTMDHLMRMQLAFDLARQRAGSE
jgi:antitoxin HigA-1